MLRLAVATVDDVLIGAGVDSLPGGFGDSERARWNTLPRSGRCRFIASRLLLRRLLAAATGMAPVRWDISADAGCAPVARVRGTSKDAGKDAGGDAPAPAVSLAHRLDHVAAALALDGRLAVGVDVELERAPRSPPDGRAALMLSAPELARWRQLPDAQREPALLRAWVAREAWFKAAPAGAAPWDFSRIAALECAPAQANVRTWRAGPLHVALCCGDAGALAAAVCDGLPVDQPADSSFWHLRAG